MVTNALKLPCGHQQHTKTSFGVRRHVRNIVSGINWKLSRRLREIYQCTRLDNIERDTSYLQLI